MVTLQFSLDLALDVAEQEVQASINAAGTLLPTDLPAPPIYSKVNPADAPILTLALSSKTLPLPQVEDLADTRLARKSRNCRASGSSPSAAASGRRCGCTPIPGAGRLRPQPGRLAHHDRQRQRQPGQGSFDGPSRASTIDANDQLRSAARIPASGRRLPRRRTDPPLRRGANAVDAPENVRLAAWHDRTPAVILNIQRQPGANVIEVVDRIKRLLPQFQGALPAAVDMAVLTDRTRTIRASIKDIQFELLLAVALVVMVIFVFLRNIPATIIPSFAVPLSLIGTFGVMYLAGFSVNNLSLMALTIATGFVIDDAIVMIENIARYIEDGEPPMAAALRGAEQIGFTIVSLTISLIAVLIPLLFMGDVVGRLFREFAVTLAVTILISAAVSLTLVPMLCARILRRTSAATDSRLAGANRRAFEWVIGRYDRSLEWVLDRQGATLLVAIATLALTAWLYVIIPKGFFPVQDTGLIQGISQASELVSFAAMADRQTALADVILKDPHVGTACRPSSAWTAPI